MKHKCSVCLDLGPIPKVTYMYIYVSTPESRLQMHSLRHFWLQAFRTRDTCPGTNSILISGKQG